VSVSKTTVRVERDASPDSAEASLTYELLLDRRVVATLADGETQCVDVEPGDHSLAVKRHAAELSISEIRCTASASGPLTSLVRLMTAVLVAIYAPVAVMFPLV